MPLAKSTDDIFSFAQLAIGGQMTRREVQHLYEAGLMPSGQNTRAFKRVAATGAFKSAAVPLLAAGRIVKVIVEEMNQYDGEAVSGLEGMAQGREDVIALLPKEADKTTDFHWHLALNKTGVYQRGRARKSDAIFEIVERRYLMQWSGYFPAPQLVGEIKEWERGSNAKIVNIVDNIEGLPGPLEPWSEAHSQSWNKQMGEQEAKARLARENAVARVTVNLSLAIRNAFDRLYKYRIQ